MIQRPGTILVFITHDVDVRGSSLEFRQGGAAGGGQRPHGRTGDCCRGGPSLDRSTAETSQGIANHARGDNEQTMCLRVDEQRKRRRFSPSRDWKKTYVAMMFGLPIRASFGQYSYLKLEKLSKTIIALTPIRNLFVPVLYRS